MKYFIFFLLLGLFLYSYSLFCGFVWDDKALIVENSLIKEKSNFAQIFKTPLFYPRLQKSTFFRPLQQFSYFLEYQLFGLNSSLFHLTNIFLHILNSLLVFSLILKIFKLKNLAFLTSLFFLIHPLNTETVCYISGRADSLMGLFILLSFLSFILYERKNYLFIILSLFLFLLSLFSKEASVVYPFWIFIFIKFFGNRRLKKSFFLISLYLIPLLIYIYLRFFLLKIPSPDYSQGEFTVMERFLTLPLVFLQYLRILLLPWGLHMGRNISLLGKYWFVLYIQWMLLISILILILKCAWRERILRFSLLWFFIFLLPQIPPFPLNTFLAEHFLYLPQIGFFLGFSFLLLKWSSGYKNLILASFVTFFVAQTILTSFSWKSNKTLYEKIIRYSPNAHTAYNNLGVIYLDERNLPLAYNCFIKAISIKPNFLEARLNLARYYYLEGDFKKAIGLCKGVIKGDPENYHAWNYLGSIFLREGDFKKAEFCFKKAININPSLAPLWYDLYLYYLEIGKNQEAEVALKKALRLDKDYISRVYYSKAEELLFEGRYLKALDYINKAIEEDTSKSEYYNLRGVILKKRKYFREALKNYSEAIRLDPRNFRVYNNLGVISILLNRTKEAELFFKKALRINNEFFDAWINLGILYYQKGRFFEAERCFLKAKKISPCHLLLKSYLKE